MKEFKLNKTRAKNEIIFQSDKDDEDLIYIITKEVKSGKISSKRMIISKDMPEFLKLYTENGWFIPEVIDLKGRVLVSAPVYKKRKK